MSNEIEEPLDSEQVARMLKVKPRTVTKLAREGKIPAFQVGDLWRFRRSDVEAYIQRQIEQAMRKEN